MKFTVVATTVTLLLSVASGLTPTKSTDVYVDKRVEYTVQGLASELITHGIFDTLTFFRNIARGGILTQTD
ncbi:hypothetical protein Cantr_08385 [Candida viswanathii]|uniref:Uncharacterized protein n=1 Tax=Candida viswanathii TaxID=5486 RepID=A0A367Y5Y0_9ASCO|nr:hypothetical protein Cantr_08385 [Candida viswanathii]